MTGVYNRHYLNEWLQRLEPSEHEISLIMVDCREFKKINDQLGHLAGDRILKEATLLIHESVRSMDSVVRYGGDEFLIVLVRIGAEGAAQIGGRLTVRLAQWNADQLEGLPRFALDIGVETSQETEWQLLMERADVRVYSNKRAIAN